MRPEQPILAATSEQRAYREMALVRGVRPLMIPRVERLSVLFEKMHEAILRSGEVKSGDSVVVTAGFPLGQTGASNLIKIETVP